MRAVEGGTELTVWAKPRASRSEVIGIRSASPRSPGDVLQVRIAAPPVEGAANVELLAFLAHALRIPQRDVELVHGASGRRKRVHIQGLRPEEVLVRLRAGV